MPPAAAPELAISPLILVPASVVGQFGVAETGALTEPSAVAPDAAVNLGDDGREYKGSGKTHFLHGSRIKFIQFTLACILLNKEVDSSIRRYRAS